MRGFKRFGGEFSGNGDPGDFRIATIGVFLLVVLCVVAFLAEEPFLVIVGFLILLFFTFISTFFKGGVAKRLLRKIMDRRLEGASMQYESGNFVGCLKTLDRIRILGTLPSEYEEMYKTASERSQKSFG